MAGLTAANKLYKSGVKKGAFELCVIEGGNRIGGRINTSEFGGDRIEMGATWIHGIGGSPIYEIAREIKSLESDQPWECMDGFLDDPITIAENGYVLSPYIVDPVSNLFNNLMDFAQGKKKSILGGIESDICVNGNLDYLAESEYVMFPGEEITIAKGYSSIIESIASALPSGVIQLGKKVNDIEWQPECVTSENKHGYGSRPVKIHFLDGTSMSADHVIVTVSLGVLKAGVINKANDSVRFGFSPTLPSHKIEAISRLGYGVVNKLFLKLSPDFDLERFPFLQMVFHKSDHFKNPKIPWWIRKTASLSPIYEKSRVLLSWFAGEEALKLESLPDEVILDDVSTTISSFLSQKDYNGNVKFEKVLKSGWDSDPLFMGSYSYIAVGSSSDDIDTLAEPLPNTKVLESTKSGSPLQILFAGEATDRTHYSTTHGAYISGLREADRLLEHYHCIDV
ncbi:amine oxidase, FAD/NAD(P)-binding domain protein [Artemisia annua]|uniref:Amine oxidase, FAD/NAD(P)-binding domain protein n=1 Tax=Artemisia annua TaxID=35608 RepID=A0A2U1LLK9_ARTAN|nr:amine oxidase, FAD/NAD(P)-binding domain protein [Artemisia annua]